MSTTSCLYIQASDVTPGAAAQVPKLGCVPPLGFRATSLFSRLIRFAVLLRLPGVALPRRTQNSVAAARDLVHPHNVHDVQADAGADPGYPATPRHQVEGFRAVDRIHATVVDRHDSDADHEKHHRHGDAVRHVGPRGLGVTKYFEEPAETQQAVNNNGAQMDVKVIFGELTG